MSCWFCGEIQHLFIVEGNRPLEAPTMSLVDSYTEIEPGLWIGSCPQHETPPFADAVLNLFGLTPYEHKCPVYREERLLDLDVPDPELLDDLAEWVHEQRQHGLTVLIHCEEGRNRSALIAGLYLIRYRAVPPVDTIELIRAKRGQSALYNGSFVRFLRAFDGERSA